MKKRYVAPQSKYYHFVLEGFLANSQNLGIHEDRADEGFVELSHKLEGIWGRGRDLLVTSKFSVNQSEITEGNGAQYCCAPFFSTSWASHYSRGYRFVSCVFFESLLS